MALAYVTVEDKWEQEAKSTAFWVTMKSSGLYAGAVEQANFWTKSELLSARPGFSVPVHQCRLKLLHKVTQATKQLVLTAKRCC